MSTLTPRKYVRANGIGRGQLYVRLAKDEYEALIAANMHNLRIRAEKREAREEAIRRNARATITLPKLKFMGEK